MSGMPGSRSSFSNVALAVRQHVSGVTGDRTNPMDRVKNTPNEMLNVGRAVAASVGSTRDAWSNINAPVNPNTPDARPPTKGEQTARVLRAAQATIGAVLGALGAPKDALNVGFANLTAPLAAIFPSLPSATLMSLYMGTPHCHPTHPPSGPPPIPPTPLPSMGMVMLSTSVKVLIEGKPAELNKAELEKTLGKSIGMRADANGIIRGNTFSFSPKWLAELADRLATDKLAKGPVQVANKYFERETIAETVNALREFARTA